MNAERNRILEMVSEHKISPADAEQLLRAMAAPRPARWKWLFSPLEMVDTRTAIAISAAIGLLQLLVSQLHVRFDGALDSHLAAGPTPIGLAFLDLGLSWPLTALGFWGIARLFGRAGRIADYLGAVGLARFPLVLVGGLTGLLRGHLAQVVPGELDPIVLGFVLIVLPFVAWFITLQVMGMRAASGLRGAKLTVAFLAAIVSMEIVTKLILALF